MDIALGKSGDMFALEVHLNGQKKFTAGFTGPGTVTALLHCVVHAKQGAGHSAQWADVSVAGHDVKVQEYVDWLRRQALNPGDEVTFRVVDTTSPDPPPPGAHRITDDERQKEYVLELAKKFGWKITFNPQ